MDVVGGGGHVWRCLNVYLPPAHCAEVDLSILDCLPRMDEGAWIVGGDWNGHDRRWDDVGLPDRQGEWLSGWFDDRGLFVLNDGSVTREE